MILVMTKTIFLIVVLFSLVACSGHPANEKDPAERASKSGVKLNLDASPRQGFVPLHVTLHGELEGAQENDPKYYCLQEEWDFGDGAKSTEKPNCDPYSATSKIKTEFFADRTYEKEGVYTIRLVLGEEGKEQIRSRQVSVKVLERTLNSN